MTRGSAKWSGPIQPVSPVVCAIGCIRHFSHLCDGWYAADDIVTMLIQLFALSEDHRHQLTPIMLRREIENDPAMSSVDTASQKEIGIYERNFRKRCKKNPVYYYFISSSNQIIPHITRDDRWRAELRSLDPGLGSKDIPWPPNQKKFFEDIQLRLTGFLQSKCKPNIVTPPKPIMKKNATGEDAKQKNEAAAEHLISKLHEWELLDNLSEEFTTSFAVLKMMFQLDRAKHGHNIFENITNDKDMTVISIDSEDEIQKIGEEETE